ncbi:outer membrane efflux protein [Legionella steigerwaltii]|uniref:Outer membrane efflux protein n=1 Tax=Legionella steigerwaltii TaxID=460 RepID=A0A378L5D2_9GAMM|nr:efflux transporter outer membrane subunit [Legionella steigerwaltii]KTD77191.1 outer membrane efflux protein [Legionella steigerwaltii]STY21917.1 outer membrane efflux protein [Legionella steigerwaltii]
MQKIYLFLCTILLTSCKVGPNFHSPAAPKATLYNKGPLITKTVSASTPAGKSQHLHYNRDISNSWWTLFHSRELNSLIEQGLKNNPTVEMSKANLHKAHANLLFVAGPKLFPTASTQFFGSRERNTLLATGINITPLPGQKLPFTLKNQFDLYNASVNVSYSLDLFGGNLRQVEALRAEIDYERFELEAAYLTLTANIVTTSITIASLQDQLKTTQDLINCQRELLRITTNNYNLGHISRLDLLSNENRLKKTLATLPSIKDSLARKYNALAVLVGSLPSESHHINFTLNSLHLPTELPVSLPSQLVRQRPDLRSAEAMLHKASAEIGVATADLFPKFNILANYGWFSTTLSNLFNPMNSVWSYGGQIAQTLLKGGALRAKRKMAIAEYEYAFAKYKKIMLEAFLDVADVLHALEFDAELLQAQVNVEQNTRARFNLIANQHQLGKINYISVLSAKEAYLNAHLNVIRTAATRYNDTAALFQSLGGGWWNNPQNKE